jgi:uncharacterized protein
MQQRIRYTKRICQDAKKIEDFLATMRVGTLAMITDDGPYAVPVNFVWFDQSLYFHGLATGRKSDALQKNPSVCLTVFKENGTVVDPMPCAADTAYMSVVLFGSALLVEAVKEKTMALQKIVDKYMPGYYEQTLTEKLVDQYHSAHDQKSVQVYKICPETFTAKENYAASEDLFMRTEETKQ